MGFFGNNVVFYKTCNLWSYAVRLKEPEDDDGRLWQDVAALPQHSLKWQVVAGCGKF